MKREVGKFLILAFSAVILLNSFILAGTVSGMFYGRFRLNPGENYTVNLPFIIVPFQQLICGVAETVDGELLEDIEVILSQNGTEVARNITDEDGKYCISIDELEKATDFEIHLDYEDEADEGNLILGSNDYNLNLDDEEIYNKSEDEFVYLTGEIENEDAKIEDGRFEINLQYYNESSNKSSKWEKIFDYQTYRLNIESRETYQISIADFNPIWKIPDDALIGRYKFYIRTSFNAEEKTSSVYFNLTE